jgi:ATP-dependent DNA helicase PIF1
MTDGLFHTIRFCWKHSTHILTSKWRRTNVASNMCTLLLLHCQQLSFRLTFCQRCACCRYKYCFKAPDYATVVVDEIESYITGRLLSASEAVWRILSLKMHKEHPAVVRLDVHMPDHQNVIFDPTSDVRDIFEAAERSSSTLLEWFALNVRDPSARRHLYTEIPEFYVWQNGTWMPREKKGCIAVGRMFNVSIYNYELFALRTLLKCQRGCQNFSDLLMVDGFIHSTFRSACSAFGMSNDDSEFIACFAEFVETTVASLESIRHQFAMMLCSIKTVNARAIFEHFCEDLIGDDCRSVALRSIQHKMQQIGRSLLENDFQFEDVPTDVFSHNDDISADVVLPPLTDEQSQALDEILSFNINDSTSKVVAVVAPAGTGKTLFVQHAVRALKRRGSSSLCVAASCLAATLLPQGRTAHAALKIPINADDESFCNWDVANRDRLASCDVIFWDEVSMVSKSIAETVDRSFKRLLDNDAMFGGKVMVFLGDFRQLPPVIRGGRGERTSVMNAEWFKQARRFKFTRNFRSVDAQYTSMLDQIGDGVLQTVDIPPSCVALTLDDAIAKVYGEDITNALNATCMMLAFTLEQCKITNDAVLEKMAGAATFADAVDDLSQCRSPDEYPPEYVASLHIHGAPPAALTLKTGARYMILRNISPPHLCNGVLAELIDHTRLLCTMRLLTGPGTGQIVKLPRVSFHVTSENSGIPFSFVRRQFPMSPAYCVTVHKSQGQTLSKIAIIADTDAFAHGLVYVALSRVGKWADVTFHSPRNERFLINKVCRDLIE